MNWFKALSKSVIEIQGKLVAAKKESVQLRTKRDYFKQQSRANNTKIWGIRQKKLVVIGIGQKIENRIGIIGDNDIYMSSLFPSDESKNQLNIKLMQDQWKNFNAGNI